jgi:phenylalanyl-tRNA synthetase beta chain
MKFSESWLRSFVNPPLNCDELSHLLTMAGLEVEELDPVAPPFTEVVVAQVLEVVKHPDADRLNVCRVDVGDGTPRQIVCGAPNVAAGLKVPCALPGAVLPGDFRIKLAKVRGIESSGMLCSAKELGITDEASGLLVLADDAPVGTALRSHLNLDDHCYTIKLTPNRADCLSLTGVAREVAALTGAPVSYPQVVSIAPVHAEGRAIVLDAPAACPRYCGRLIKGVDARAASPEWMKQRLERSGIRSISALVDITNYVMLELGQPLHAFDNARLDGALHVRLAQPGEELLLLNEQKVPLAADVLVIADERQPLAMAGIMGGEGSGITLATTDLFLESAFFAPRAIAGRARRHGFASDASHRYERGVDFAGCRRALERATELVLAICGGAPGPVCVAEAEATLPARQPVRLRPARVTRVLGVAFAGEHIGEILDRLALAHERSGDDFLVTPPSYRFDLEIEEDLIEEVARLHGYDNIPALVPRGLLAMLPSHEQQRPLAALRRRLAASGYQEVINYAFVERAWERDFAANEVPLQLANPIASQLAVMRTTLLGGLVATLDTNLRRKQSRVRIFEVGRCFLKGDASDVVPGYRQPLRLAGLAYGGAMPEQWGSAAQRVDFFDVKGDLEAIFAPACGRYEKVAHPALHPGRAARIVIGEREVGVVGELHPEWVQKYGLPQAPVVFELELAPLLAGVIPSYREISRQQPVIRDLALVVDQKYPLGDVLAALQGAAGALVRDIQLFDLYVGKGVPEGKKSLAFRIVMQDTQRTLQDAEVDAAIQHLVVQMQMAFAAELRA